MNELKFGSVSMVSDNAFSSLPVGGITIGVTLMPQFLFKGLGWAPLVLPSYSFSVFQLWKTHNLLC